MIEGFDIAPFLLSFRLAAITTVVLFIVSLPLAWVLSQTKSGLKPFIEALVSMPIVLPPTVLGFYLLVLLSARSPLGMFFQEHLHLDLVFTFEGILIASCVYSFPFMLQPLQAGMEQVPAKILEASYTLGKSRLQTLFHVIVPNIKPSMLTGLIITFAHTVGEFGVVLMVGGSIQGETRVASIAIYELVELMDYSTAHIYSFILIAFSFAVLMTVYSINHRYKASGW
jgi:molybdate transport system permease protein